MNALHRAFERGAKAAARFTGQPLCFGLAVGVVLVWVISGPLFGFSDTWQLVINTGTTIVTFLMVFLIQNSQNRDSTAVQIKLDELIRATESAENSLLDLEELDEVTLEEFRARYEQLACKARDLLDETKRAQDADSGDDRPDPTARADPRASGDSEDARRPGAATDSRAAADRRPTAPDRPRPVWPTSED
ncbi:MULTISPECIES: low affinity iron permease family protein [unclassified Lysobacter]|uniref:low affinity iron permease family protein n=1 Tax=unclassified Lysobacter TaxID=2635362 RepID=UPI001BE9B024|nr:MULTISPECIES: low affinity iron permease family protein [unclassified Lysobacter]MBT2747479.1 low affinity iron permease family protein [Lysobacter sp. ISL-42]MBT2752725.1 low affinity iron permease family protein [Lysobacter sp. ISL-50]MBT2778382.1 low affinity iron permease family protein [Lysobacter sp. ISL-54]MBT2783900.1 low affinity iron permease family protein [Lysobacter sp. ISL-52]